MKRFALRWLCAISLCWLVLPALWAAPDSSQVIRRFGLFVGANNGGKERARLQWAVSDVQRISQVMTELGGMQAGDVIILTDPRLSDVQQAISRMKTEVNKAQGDARRVEFMFYYSGHSDEEGLLLGDDRFAYKLLRQAITEVKADVSIAVLDSCASGAFTRQKGGVRVQPFLVDSSSDMKGYAFLTSASENESAQESDRLGASFFTYYLVSALRGAASTGNNRVTLNEAYKYAFNETLARTESTTSGPQHPSYDINLSGSGDLVLSDLSQPSASLLLKDDLDGRVSIRDQKGYLVMEINKNPGKPLLIALQPGNYTLRIETAAGVYLAPARLTWHQEAQVSKLDFQKTQLVATRTRGNTSSEQIAAVPDPAAEDVNSDRVLDAARARYRDAERDHETRDKPGNAATIDNPPPIPQEPPAPLSDLLNGIGTWQAVAEASAGPADNSGDSSQTAATNDAPSSEPGNSETQQKLAFHLALVPGISTAGRSRNVYSVFSFSPLIASVSRNSGVMLSGLININEGTEEGYQGSGLINTSAELVGVQTAGIGNINSGSALGVQSAGIFNIDNGSMRGMQIAGLFNIDGITVEGVQAAGLFNIGSDSITGLQIAGLFNKSKSFSGVQIAGLINIADTANGVQVGVVNFAKHMEGMPIGIVNIIMDGIHDLSVWSGGDDRIYLGILNGSKSFYSTMFVGIYQRALSKDASGLVLGYGVGSRWRIGGPLYMDLEINVKHPTIGNTDTQRGQSLFNTLPGENTVATGLRLIPGIRLVAGIDLKYVKGFVGLNLDVFTPAFMTPTAYYGHEPTYAMKFNLGTLPITVNPQVQFGISVSI